ncbi:ParB/RepB/Spo0J family partition protein [Tabrizicola sp.]|uniref:ParB/RepB/Spo0J family partition protein n=1 Tax=Tabrizicola sp. TaxID=2005166 RepID=UPI003F34A28D
MDTLTHLPLTEIDPYALLRDRTALDPAALHQLQYSIATEGLRMPIEVWQLSTPRDGYTHGLISGLRRLTAARALGHQTIPAFLRTPASIPQAMAAMVTENEIRSPVSPWEKGLLIMATVEEGHFETPDAAVAALYKALPRQTRTRLRYFANVAEALDGLLSTPERLSTRQMDRIATALRSNMEDVIRATLFARRGEGLESQWSALLPLINERDEPETTPTRPGRPRRLLQLKQGLTIRREPCRNGWLLRFTGEEARKGALIDDIFDLIEDKFQRR